MKKQSAAEDLGMNMYRIRDALRLTQAEMARRARIPRATWAQIESGKGNPTLANLVEIARALDVRVDCLLKPIHVVSTPLVTVDAPKSG